MTEYEQRTRRRIAQELATLFDESGGPDGMWEAGDIIQAIAYYIGQHDGWSTCERDGLLFASSKRACPYCP